MVQHRLCPRSSRWKPTATSLVDVGENKADRMRMRRRVVMQTAPLPACPRFLGLRVLRWSEVRERVREGGAEGCGRGKRSVWLEEVRDQSWDELMVQSGWGRVCGRVVGGREGEPGPATVQGRGRLTSPRASRPRAGRRTSAPRPVHGGNIVFLKARCRRVPTLCFKRMLSRGVGCGMLWSIHGKFKTRAMSKSQDLLFLTKGTKPKPSKGYLGV